MTLEIIITPASWRLQALPACVSDEDVARLSNCDGKSIRVETLIFEEMLEKYQHPLFMLLVADSLFRLQSDAMGLELCMKAQQVIKASGSVDEELDNFIVTAQILVQEKAEKKLAKSEQTTFFQRWTQTRNQKFPLSLPQLPSGHELISQDWATLKSSDNGFLDRFMTSLAIDTNQVESVFSLTEASYMDLIRRGISNGKVSCYVEEEDMLQDHGVIKQIISDTLAAYDLLDEIVRDPKTLTRDLICKIHARLMKNSKLLPNLSTYISPGVTRTATQKTVVISGAYSIECCPYAKVDDELDYICRMAKQYIVTWRNPFSTASWVHLILARCHPFEEGNGRVARMLASVPLIRCGFPPIYISMSQKQAYYEGIKQACDGNHKPFIECVVKCMEEHIAFLRNIL